jgi:5-formyltetrahydrofolate cyclo-ligase
MVRERFGTFRPDGPVGLPDFVFVPLLAFDAAGNRLGYGGGFYDRTLAALPGAEAIGFAYAAQQVAQVPAEAHDRALRRVVTEAGVVSCATAAG